MHYHHHHNIAADSDVIYHVHDGDARDHVHHEHNDDDTSAPYYGNPCTANHRAVDDGPTYHPPGDGSD